MVEVKKEPTKAQIATLKWLVDRGATKEVRGGTLIDLYAQRARDERLDEIRAREGREPTESEVRMASYSSTDHKHGWRRVGGRVLAAMARAGLLRQHGWSWGTALYDVTDHGFEVARRQT